MSDDIYSWPAALERALRYYVYAHLKCRVFKDEQGRWRSRVITADGSGWVIPGLADEPR
jgi:hypothetical protein